MNEELLMKKTSLPLLAIFCLLPGLQTAVAVYWGWQTAITYPLLKVVMIAIPVIVWLQVRRGGAPIAERIGWKRTNLRAGLSVGIVMGGVILAGYYGLLREVIDPGPVLAKVRSLGLVEYYWHMSIFICLGNALFEEYYWRAFLIGELRSYLRSKPVLCIVAGGLFGVHHLFAMLLIVVLDGEPEAHAPPLPVKRRLNRLRRVLEIAAPAEADNADLG